MYFYLAYLSYFVILLSCGNMNTDVTQPLNRDTLFVNWNNETLLSLNNHIHSSNEASEKETYNNRLLAFKAFVDIRDYTEVNVNSIRYRFLQELFKDANKNGDFYVIEANRSGESVEIKNYVAFINDKNIDRVIIYNFNDGKWIRENGTIKMDLPKNIDPKNQFVKFGSGFNQDDVIIKQFRKYKIYSCEYYIYNTLSGASSFKKILSK
jgi:hypothetical protein